MANRQKNEDNEEKEEKEEKEKRQTGAITASAPVARHRHVCREGKRKSEQRSHCLPARAQRNVTALRCICRRCAAAVAGCRVWPAAALLRRVSRQRPSWHTLCQHRLLLFALCVSRGAFSFRPSESLALQDAERIPLSRLASASCIWPFFFLAFCSSLLFFFPACVSPVSRSHLPPVSYQPVAPARRTSHVSCPVKRNAFRHAEL